MVFLIQAIVERLEGASKDGKENAFTTERNNVKLDKEVHVNRTNEKRKKEGCC